MKKVTLLQLAVALVLCLALAVVGLRLVEIRQELEVMRTSIDRAIEELYMGDGMYFFLDPVPEDGEEAFR